MCLDKTRYRKCPVSSQLKIQAISKGGNVKFGCKTLAQQHSVLENKQRSFIMSLGKENREFLTLSQVIVYI